MTDTRSRLVVILAAAALALPACTSDAEPGSTSTQNANPTSAQSTAPGSTQKASPTNAQTTAPGSTDGAAPSGSASPDIAAEQKAMEAEQVATQDVKLGALSVDPKGARSAEVAITNNSSKPSNYVVDLQLVSADGKTRLDTAMVSAVGVAAGKTTTLKAEFASTGQLPKGAQITIVGVARLAP